MRSRWDTLAAPRTCRPSAWLSWCHVSQHERDLGCTVRYAPADLCSSCKTSRPRYGSWRPAVFDLHSLRCVVGRLSLAMARYVHTEGSLGIRCTGWLWWLSTCMVQGVLLGCATRQEHSVLGPSHIPTPSSRSEVRRLHQNSASCAVPIQYAPLREHTRLRHLHGYPPTITSSWPSVCPAAA